MNHAEEAAYWYLRLNGFFPISNFVIHRSSSVQHTSDCDVLGVRLPFVHEEVGGQEDDWDSFLREHLDLRRPIGLLCEVKSGDYDVDRVFREEVLSYAVGRLGVVRQADLEVTTRALAEVPVLPLDDGWQIVKLLVARDPVDGAFLTRSLDQVEGFLDDRVRAYPKQKYADRMYFGPVLFQTVIERVGRPDRALRS